MTKEKPKPYKEEWYAQWDEKTLSDLEIKGMYYRENLKQAIKRLKEKEIVAPHMSEEFKLGMMYAIKIYRKETDKIFGDKLTK